MVAERLIAGRKEHERGLGVEKKSERLVAVNPGATEFDSVVLAKVLKYMAVLEEKELSQSQIQCILYIAYGSPWADTRKSNSDSWGARIEDSLIREWFLPGVWTPKMTDQP